MNNTNNTTSFPINTGISTCLLGERVRFDAGIRENFIVRVFSYHRWKQLRSNDFSRGTGYFKYYIGLP